MKVFLELDTGTWIQKKLELWGYRAKKEFDNFSCLLDTIHERVYVADGRMDRQDTG